VLPVERYQRIEQALRTGSVAATDEVARELGVSVETIRRDFMTMEQRGVVRRVHGGVVSAGSTFAAHEPSFVDRALLAGAEKATIATAAAAMVSDGQLVVMDIGTTILAVARALGKEFRGTVATCSLLVASELANRVGVQVLLSGGRLRGGDLALSNGQTLGFFADLHADIAFLGCGGIDPAGGLTDHHFDEVATRRLMIANSAHSYVVADHRKLGLIAPHRVCGLDGVDGVITDGEPPTPLRLNIEKAGGHLVCV